MLHDYAVLNGSFLGTRRGQVLELSFQRLQLPDFSIHRRYFRPGHCTHIRGRSLRCCQLKKLIYLLESKSQILGMLDESQAAHGFIGIKAITRNGPRWSKQQPTSFVIADSRGFDRSLFSELADRENRHGTILNPSPRCKVQVGCFRLQMDPFPFFCFLKRISADCRHSLY